MWRQAALGATLACVTGCAALSPDADPGTLYRDIVGGDVAPPPGQDGPWPNLASVPPRPARPPVAERQRIQDVLVADRANARHVGGPTPPVAAAPAPPLRLPDGAEVAAMPPPPPPLPGVPQVTMPPAPPPPSAPAPREVEVSFARGASALPAAAAVALRDLAGARGTRQVFVLGAGDAGAPGGDALALGLARAGAVANALRQAGVPAEAIRIGAEPAGRGVVARLIQ